MKSRLIKISILLLGYFVLNFIIGCENKHIEKDFFSISSIFIEENKVREDLKQWGLKIGIITKYERTEQIVNLSIAPTALFATDAPRLLPHSLSPEDKIVKFGLKTIPNEINLKTILETKEQKGLNNFIDNINNNFGNKYGFTIEFSSNFYFTKVPKELKDKNFRIVFSIKTKGGKVFADTTKTINFNYKQN